MKNIDLIDKTLDALAKSWNTIDYEGLDLKRIHHEIETNNFDEICFVFTHYIQSLLCNNQYGVYGKENHYDSTKD